MRWETNNDKLSSLQFYQEMGLSCSLVKGNDDDMDSYKNPSLDSIKDLSEQDLSVYTGIGVHLGASCDIRAIDIDDFHIQVDEPSDSDSSRLYRFATFFFVRKCMSLLGLPEDYEWLIRTPHGWHIIISAPSFGFKKAVYRAKGELKPRVISGNVIHLNHIELLWDGFLVMPPSKYGKYTTYNYYNQKPQNKPARVEAGRLLDFICFYCGEMNYVTHLTDNTSYPIIGDAHLFPHYKLFWDYGSMYYEDGPNLENLSENREFLNACRNSIGFNMKGFMLVYNDLISNYKVDKQLDTAIKSFRMANDAWGHYNLACLMAIGAMPGSINELYTHLERSDGFPDEYKDQLKLLYLAKNYSYEKYAVIDIGVDENKRIEKIAILIVDEKGNILDKRFLLSDSVMLENMFHALEAADYVAGCDLTTVEELVRHECEICGDSFSYDSTGCNSNGGWFTEHIEGNYLDAFRRPWINASPIQTNEKDPFRRVFKIKDLIIKKIEEK